MLRSKAGLGSALLLMEFLASGALAEAVLLPDFTARYKIEKAGLDVIQSTITLESEGSRRHYRSVSEAIGMLAWFFGDHKIVEESVLEVHEGRIRPLLYDYAHHGSDEDRNLHYDFDWRIRQADIDDEGEQKQIAVPEDTLDNFSLQLALIRDAADGRQTMDYPVISKGDLKTYRFTRLGTDTVETPAGRFEAVKLQRVKDDEERTTYTTWYAPKLSYLPVQVEKTENGDRVMTMRLQEVQWR